MARAKQPQLETASGISSRMIDFPMDGPFDEKVGPVGLGDIYILH